MCIWIARGDSCEYICMRWWISETLSYFTSWTYTHPCQQSGDAKWEFFKNLLFLSYRDNLSLPFSSHTDTRNVFPPRNVIPTILVHKYLFVILWIGLSLIKILLVRFIFSLFLLTHFIFLVLCSNYVILVFLPLKNTSKSQKLYSMWYFHFIPQIII